jgi:hypothetical protein
VRRALVHEHRASELARQLELSRKPGALSGARWKLAIIVEAAEALVSQVDADIDELERWKQRARA